jgi:site-specific DNA recombinase
VPQRNGVLPARRMRCAIYTRKSSEEGLEQDFNSLDAQRETCEAYIKSQIHAGWRAIDIEYNDGGISGATMARPALQRLLSDVQARKVDIVVVYKVDRLTRSLADFAKIVEIFDNQGISFVSVTQSFNTTTSMGRLTLNVLLSFAQFEREVTGERIRDKIAASKKKGMWMGGFPPLGYDVVDRKLVLNAVEAETVRDIFQRYRRIGNVRELKIDLDRSRIVTKSRIQKSGPTGAKPFSRGALSDMLKNRIYLGEIVHKGVGYLGEHTAIIDRDLWDEITKTLNGNQSHRENCVGVKEPSLLKGLIFDAEGARMIPSHAVKHGKRYRYYVSQTLIDGKRASSYGGQRIPAGDIEKHVLDRLGQFFGSSIEIHDAVSPFGLDAIDLRRLIEDTADLAQNWPTLPLATRNNLLRKVVNRIVVEPLEIKVELKRSRLIAELQPSM